MIYFDGVVNSRGEGIGVILISPKGKMIPIVKILEFKVTNNQAKYEACIFGLEALRNTSAREIIIYRDSMLIIK